MIPSNPSRARPVPYDRDLYKERQLVECFFAKIRQLHRIATCHEKTAANFLAVTHLAATMIWLR